MTVHAFAAPTTPLGSSYAGGNPATALVLPATEQYPLVSGDTGFTVPNNGMVLVRVVIGASAPSPSNFSLVIQKTVESVTPAAVPNAVVINTAYIAGPFDTAEFNDVNGLLNVTLNYAAGISVGVYTLPSSRYGQ